MKIGFLITARLKSKRLPNKILRKVEKEPLLSHMIKRIKRSKQVDTIIVCTSYLKADKKIKNIKKNPRNGQSDRGLRVLAFSCP